MRSLSEYLMVLEAEGDNPGQAVQGNQPDKETAGNAQDQPVATMGAELGGQQDQSSPMDIFAAGQAGMAGGAGFQPDMMASGGQHGQQGQYSVGVQIAKKIMGNPGWKDIVKKGVGIDIDAMSKKVKSKRIVKGV